MTDCPSLGSTFLIFFMFSPPFLSHAFPCSYHTKPHEFSPTKSMTSLMV